MKVIECGNEEFIKKVGVVEAVPTIRDAQSKVFGTDTHRTYMLPGATYVEDGLPVQLDVPLLSVEDTSGTRGITMAMTLDERCKRAVVHLKKAITGQHVNWDGQRYKVVDSFAKALGAFTETIQDKKAKRSMHTLSEKVKRKEEIIQRNVELEAQVIALRQETIVLKTRIGEYAQCAKDATTILHEILEHAAGCCKFPFPTKLVAKFARFPLSDQDAVENMRLAGRSRRRVRQRNKE